MALPRLSGELVALQLVTPFSFFVCQHGAESTIKSALCEPHGRHRLAYSQNGFVTLKAPTPAEVWSPDLPGGPFVRARGHALKRFEGPDILPLVEQVLGEFAGLDWTAMHVWQRDPVEVGWRGFEPDHSVSSREVAAAFTQALQVRNDPRAARVNVDARLGQRILDVVLIERERWWVGTHPVLERADGWPGGTFSQAAPANMVSRAYLKISEALAWSGLPLRPGDRVVEIGSSPGGACQRLLEMGMHVTGIDPAEMDPAVLAHPRFQHWRARSLQVKRRLFQPFRWLMCDANVAPDYTLDTVESIVTYPGNQFAGLLLTIKLSDWHQTQDLPRHLERVRRWGFTQVTARQLAHNRREYCLAARR